MRRFDLGWVGCAGLVLSLAACASARATDGPAAGATGTPAAGATGVAAQPLLTYCDLVGSPLRYLGKEVRVVGVYRVGFEWQELYSTRCPDGYSTWVEWRGGYCADVPQPQAPAADDSEDSHHRAEDSPELSGATFGLIARGTLTGGDGVGYGHLNAYTFQFHLSCVESMELLDERSYHVHALTRDMRRKIERFLARTDPAKARPQ